MEFTRLEEVRAGWSGDRKYHAWDDGDQEFFLRLSQPEKWEKAQSAFALQEKAFQLGLPVSEPIELAKEDGQVRFVERWLSGQMAEDALPALPQEEQYRLGWEAGEILRALHTIPAPAEAEDWESRFNRKMERKIQLYRECPFQYENGEAFIRYMEENRGLLRGRPQCMQHGDYHTGNMMLCGGKLFVIDFDRPDAGDPWEEFNRIVWSAQLSPAFARGTVDGYFDGAPPLAFWKLLALYIANNTLGSLPWAVPFGEEQMDIMREQAAQVLDWYDGMENPVPPGTGHKKARQLETAVWLSLCGKVTG